MKLSLARIEEGVIVGLIVAALGALAIQLYRSTRAD